MSFPNSLKQLFFITNLDKNKNQEISKDIISLSNNRYKSFNNEKIFSIYDKRHYKLNNDLNIYPSPERIINNSLKPIKIKTGLINSNQRNIKQKSQFYLPIMKKSKKRDSFKSFLLEESINISKLKDSIFRHKKLKSLENKNKTVDNNNINDEIKKKRKKEKNEVCPLISCSLDKNGKPKLNRAFLNFDIYNKIANKNKVDDFLGKISIRRRNHKEQILMRNKFQHINNSNKRSTPILEDNLTHETYQLVEFQPESNYNYTENNEINSYENRKIYARDLIKEKFPNIKVTGYEQLYMNKMTSVKPNDLNQ